MKTFSTTPLTLKWVIMGYIAHLELWAEINKFFNSRRVIFNVNKQRATFRKYLLSINNTYIRDFMRQMCTAYPGFDLIIDYTTILKSGDYKQIHPRVLVRSYFVGYLLRERVWSMYRYNAQIIRPGETIREIMWNLEPIYIIGSTGNNYKVIQQYLTSVFSFMYASFPEDNETDKVIFWHGVKAALTESFYGFIEGMNEIPITV